MGIKSGLRSVLPATTRNIENRFACVGEEMGQLRCEAEAIRQTVEDQSASKRVEAAQENALSILGEIRDRVSRLESAQDKPGYCSLEYLSLNREYNGRRILLAGWYGASNCGDELMMRTMLQHFEGMGVRVSVLLWDDPNYDFSRLPACADQIHYPRSTWELRQLAEYYDALVWGGGAILDDAQFSHDPKNINTGNLVIWLSEEMLKRQKDVFAVGLSANESIESNSEYASRLSRVVQGCRHVSMRDKYSIDALKAAGVDVSTVGLCEDIVFGNREIGSKAMRDSSSYTVGVVLMMGDVTIEHNRHVLPRIIDELRSRLGESFTVRLIPFYNLWSFDTVLLKQLCEELGISDCVEIAPYTDDLGQNRLLSCDAVVAYRYHACLVAAASEIPTLFICVDDHPHYKNKMRHIAELFGMSDGLLMASTCLDDGSFDERFAALLEGYLVPRVPDGLFANAERFLDEVCSSIVGP